MSLVRVRMHLARAATLILVLTSCTVHAGQLRVGTPPPMSRSSLWVASIRGTVGDREWQLYRKITGSEECVWVDVDVPTSVPLSQAALDRLGDCIPKTDIGVMVLFQAAPVATNLVGADPQFTGSLAFGLSSIANVEGWTYSGVKALTGLDGDAFVMTYPAGSALMRIDGDSRGRRVSCRVIDNEGDVAVGCA